MHFKSGRESVAHLKCDSHNNNNSSNSSKYCKRVSVNVVGATPVSPPRAAAPPLSGGRPSLGLLWSLEMQTDLHLVLQTLLELVLRQRQTLLQDRNRLSENIQLAYDVFQGAG